MSERSMSRRDVLVRAGLAATLAAGAPPAAPARDRPPYTAVPVGRGGWAYTGASGVVLVSKAGDAGDVALRLFDFDTRSFTLYLPSAGFVASARIKPMGSAHLYKGWVYDLTWSGKPTGGPDALFASDEANKGSPEGYPTCFYRAGDEGWEFGFNMVRTRVERRMTAGGAYFKGPDGR